MFFCRVHPSKDWVFSQIPEVVRCGVEGLGDDGNDIDDMNAEAFIQAYVNIVAGACISLGKNSRWPLHSFYDEFNIVRILGH